MTVKWIEVVCVEDSLAPELEMAVAGSSKEKVGTEEVSVFSELVEIAMDVVEEVYVMEDVTAPDIVVATWSEIAVWVCWAPEK